MPPYIVLYFTSLTTYNSVLGYAILENEYSITNSVLFPW
jgi:hypothetical protein